MRIMGRRVYELDSNATERQMKHITISHKNYYSPDFQYGARRFIRFLIPASPIRLILGSGSRLCSSVRPRRQVMSLSDSRR